MWEQISAVVIAYGAIFTIIWKLRGFIVERKDIEVSGLIREYNKKIIQKKDINELIKELQATKKVQFETIENLREDLNKPYILDNNRKVSRIKGKNSLILVAVSAVLTILYTFYPDYQFLGFNLLIFAILAVLGLFASLTEYYKYLCEIKSNIEDMEKKLQESDYLEMEEIS